MSATADPSTAPAELHGDDHGHHKSFLAHHFESWQQQFDAGKLGVWIFLVQEILFFSGLFCAYAVYRMLHPEVFHYADQFLSVPHGAANTIVLLFSSLTMAWGVRCAMLGQKTGLIACIAVTLFCAAVFMGVKAFEYTEKFHAQLIWAGADPLQSSPGGVQAVPPSILHLDPNDRAVGEELERKMTQSLGRIEFGVGIVGLLALLVAVGIYFVKPHRIGMIVAFGAIALSTIGFIVGAIGSVGLHHWMHAGAHESHADPAVQETHAEQSTANPTAAADAPPGSDQTSPTERPSEVATAPAASEVAAPTAPEEGRPARLGTFFGIYYVMTGVHAIHILLGMGFLTWLLARAVKGHFTPSYFGPVDYVGLYWHLVDLVWIYLFPLLYLIG